MPVDFLKPRILFMVDRTVANLNCLVYTLTFAPLCFDQMRYIAWQIGVQSQILQWQNHLAELTAKFTNGFANQNKLDPGYLSYLCEQLNQKLNNPDLNEVQRISILFLYTREILMHKLLSILHDTLEPESLDPSSLDTKFYYCDILVQLYSATVDDIFADKDFVTNLFLVCVACEEYDFAHEFLQNGCYFSDNVDQMNDVAARFPTNEGVVNVYREVGNYSTLTLENVREMLNAQTNQRIVTQPAPILYLMDKVRPVKKDRSRTTLVLPQESTTIILKDKSVEDSKVKYKSNGDSRQRISTKTISQKHKTLADGEQLNRSIIEADAIEFNRLVQQDPRLHNIALLPIIERQQLLNKIRGISKNKLYKFVAFIDQIEVSPINCLIMLMSNRVLQEIKVALVKKIVKFNNSDFYTINNLVNLLEVCVMILKHNKMDPTKFIADFGAKNIEAVKFALGNPDAVMTPKTDLLALLGKDIASNMQQFSEAFMPYINSVLPIDQFGGAPVFIRFVANDAGDNFLHVIFNSCPAEPFLLQALEILHANDPDHIATSAFLAKDSLGRTPICILEEKPQIWCTAIKLVQKILISWIEYCAKKYDASFALAFGSTVDLFGNIADENTITRLYKQQRFKQIHTVIVLRETFRMNVCKAYLRGAQVQKIPATHMKYLNELLGMNEYLTLKISKQLLGNKILALEYNGNSEAQEITSCELFVSSIKLMPIAEFMYFSLLVSASLEPNADLQQHLLLLRDQIARFRMSIDLPNIKGFTAIDYAIDLGNFEIVKYICEECSAPVTARTIFNASGSVSDEIFTYLATRYQQQHASKPELYPSLSDLCFRTGYDLIYMAVIVAQSLDRLKLLVSIGCALNNLYNKQQNLLSIIIINMQHKHITPELGVELIEFCLPYIKDRISFLNTKDGFQLSTTDYAKECDLKESPTCASKLATLIPFDVSEPDLGINFTNVLPTGPIHECDQLTGVATHAAKITFRRDSDLRDDKGRNAVMIALSRKDSSGTSLSELCNKAGASICALDVVGNSVLMHWALHLSQNTLPILPIILDEYLKQLIVAHPNVSLDLCLLKITLYSNVVQNTPLHALLAHDDPHLVLTALQLILQTEHGKYMLFSLFMANSVGRTPWTYLEQKRSPEWEHVKQLLIGILPNLAINFAAAHPLVVKIFQVNQTFFGGDKFSDFELESAEDARFLINLLNTRYQLRHQITSAILEAIKLNPAMASNPGIIRLKKFITGNELLCMVGSETLYGRIMSFVVENSDLENLIDTPFFKSSAGKVPAADTLEARKQTRGVTNRQQLLI